MYGMVHEGLRLMVERDHGGAVWAAACAQAGLDRTEFERMSSYEDAQTYGLVGAVCAQTGRDGAELLESFGQFWVGFSKQSAYGDLLRLAGRTFLEKLGNLDDMHDRIAISMPHLNPPSFELESLSETTHRLRYISQRAGLQPMVIGLLYGLAKDTGTRIAVTEIARERDDQGFDLFDIEILS